MKCQCFVVDALESTLLSCKLEMNVYISHLCNFVTFFFKQLKYLLILKLLCASGLCKKKNWQTFRSEILLFSHNFYFLSLPGICAQRGSYFTIGYTWYSTSLCDGFQCNFKIINTRRKTVKGIFFFFLAFIFACG